MAQELVDSLTIAMFSQSGAEIIIGRENNGGCTVVVDCGIVSNTILSECRLAKVENLLGCASTFDWELGAGEDCIASTEAFSQDRCLVGSLKGVHTSNWRVRVIESFLSSFNLVKSQLKTGVNDKDVVGGFRSIR